VSSQPTITASNSAPTPVSSNRRSTAAMMLSSGVSDSPMMPRTPATLVAPDGLLAEIAQRVDRDEEVAVLARTVNPPEDFTDLWIRGPTSATAYARQLYTSLRALDAADADHILIEAVPNDDAWLAVRDRLMRATRGEADEID